MASEGRSQIWDAVADLAAESRREQEAFDPETDDARACIETGVAPIVRLYVHACREGVELSPVELSLLEGVLNDWLRSYADVTDRPSFDGSVFSLHEVAMEFVDAGNVTTAVDRLFETEERV